MILVHLLGSLAISFSPGEYRLQKVSCNEICCVNHQHHKVRPGQEADLHSDCGVLQCLEVGLRQGALPSHEVALPCGVGPLQGTQSWEREFHCHKRSDQVPGHLDRAQCLVFRISFPVRVQKKNSKKRGPRLLGGLYMLGKELQK